MVKQLNLKQKFSDYFGDSDTEKSPRAKKRAILNNYVRKNKIDKTEKLKQKYKEIFGDDDDVERKVAKSAPPKEVFEEKFERKSEMTKSQPAQKRTVSKMFRPVTNIGNYLQKKLQPPSGHALQSSSKAKSTDKMKKEKKLKQKYRECLCQ